MFLSKHKNGYYYIYYFDKFSNTRRSISTKTKLKSEALEFLTNFKNEVTLRQKSKVIPITLKEFTFNFLIYSSSIHTEKTLKGYRNTFNQLNKYFGITILSSLSPILIEKYIQFRITSSSIYAARKDLIHLSSAFNKAVKENYLLENPCSNIRRIKLPEKQPKFFTENEYKKLLAVIEDSCFKHLVEIATNTGLRQMELITLNWEQVNFKGRFILLNNRNHITKGKKIRSLPLNLKSLQILNELDLTKTNSYVFNREGKRLTQDYVSRKFKSYVKEAKINPILNFHSLRHSFASWLVQKGVSIYQVSKLLGHADIKTTEIYAHLRAEDLRESINLLNN